MAIKFTDHSQQNRLREISVTEKLEADARARRGSVLSSMIPKASPNSTGSVEFKKKDHLKGSGGIPWLSTSTQYINRVEADGGTVEARSCLNETLYYYGFE